MRVRAGPAGGTGVGWEPQGGWSTCTGAVHNPPLAFPPPAVSLNSLPDGEYAIALVWKELCVRSVKAQKVGRERG